jgi:hypothetical protein
MISAEGIADRLAQLPTRKEMYRTVLLGMTTGAYLVQLLGPSPTGSRSPCPPVNGRENGIYSLTDFYVLDILANIDYIKLDL